MHRLLSRVLQLLIAFSSIKFFAEAMHGSEGDVAGISSSGIQRRQLTPSCKHKDRASDPIARLEKLAQPLASKHQDPRLLGACRAVHKSSSNFSVDTIEDIIASSKRNSKDLQPSKYRDMDVSAYVKQRRHTFERSPRSQACGMLHPYGRFIESRDSQQPILYVEIPKTSSSTMKSWINSFCKDAMYGEGDFQSLQFTQMAPVFPNTLLSFTVVREPLKRFISGYGTIRHRVLLGGEKASHLNSSKVRSLWYSPTRAAEIGRFEKFVSVVVDEGAITQARNAVKNNCVWNHALSQMWFIEMYPQPINFVLHVETLEADLNRLRRYLPVVLPPGPPTHENAAEGSALPGYLKPEDYIKGAPSAIFRVVKYLNQDYVCLQYPLPEIRITS